MEVRKKLEELSSQELEQELLARGAKTPGMQQFLFDDNEGTPERIETVNQVKDLYKTAPKPDEALSHISTWDLAKVLMDFLRGRWGEDERVDYWKIEDDTVRKNTDCVAAICMRNNLIHLNDKKSILKIKKFGKTFNLCENEPFRFQPIAAGPLCTGFLVEEDLIATAAHFANEKNVTNLRIVFGFRKEEEKSPPNVRISRDDIYKGIKIVARVYEPRGNKEDWALVQLDRKVKNRHIARLYKDEVTCGQPVYLIGHPLGLPLKYADGAWACEVNDTYFGTHLDVYSGNSGSPVFKADTHEVIGVLARGDNRDFRWTGKGWLSVRYPNREIYSKGAECTLITRLSQVLEGRKIKT